MDELAARVLLNDRVRYLERSRRSRKYPQASKVAEFKDGGTRDAWNTLYPHEEMRLYLCPSVAKMVRRDKAKRQREIHADCDREWEARNGK